MALNTYTESTMVKTESGMENNDDLPMSVYDEYRVDAYGLIRSLLAGKYDLTEIDADASFSTSPAARLLNTIERIYASGLFLQKEFGHEQTSKAEGDAKVKQAEDRLKRILDPEDRLVLIGSDGTEYTTVSASAAGAPAMTGLVDGGESADPDFCKTDIF